MLSERIEEAILKKATTSRDNMIDICRRIVSHLFLLIACDVTLDRIDRLSLFLVLFSLFTLQARSCLLLAAACLASWVQLPYLTYGCVAVSWWFGSKMVEQGYDSFEDGRIVVEFGSTLAGWGRAAAVG